MSTRHPIFCHSLPTRTHSGCGINTGTMVSNVLFGLLEALLVQAQSPSCEQLTDLRVASERIHSEPYNVQFVSTGRWFRVTRHIDVNGVELIDIKPYGRFEQIPYEVSQPGAAT